MNNNRYDRCKCEKDLLMQYAFMEIGEIMAIVEAEEYSIFDELVEKAKSGKDLPVDETTVNSTNYKIVYGSIIFRSECFTEKETIKIIQDMTNYNFIYIQENKATVCEYCDIKLYPQAEYRNSDTMIPFVALMKLPFSLNERSNSITLTPIIGEKGKELTIFEYMINRPFILACRKEFIAENLTKENYEQYIDMKTLKKAYDLSDIITDMDEIVE